MESPILPQPALPGPKRAVRRVALACIQCRSRKVKCDATIPSCRRCQADDKSCEYQQSRRGGRPRRSHPVVSTIAIEAPQSNSSSPWAEIFATAPASTSSGNLSLRGSLNSSSGSPEIGVAQESFYSDDPVLTSVQVDQLLTQYYAYFHVSHPCVLPRWSLDSKKALNAAKTGPLIPVLLFIGSLFTPSVPSTPLAEAAEQAIIFARPFCDPPDPYFVQALTLHAIAVYWCDQAERARELLDEAIRGALDLGMHKNAFAVRHGQGDPVQEESWRRTWWQLYVTDAHIAGSTHSYPTKTGSVTITADLPCEEVHYEIGNIPTPTPLRAYDVREFSDVEFSSFAQLIGFTKGVNIALASSRYGDIDNAKMMCANADVMMTAWCSLLPKAKRTLLRDDGSLDELLFKANMLMHTYTVDLHRQLSTLKYMPIESISKCAPPPPPDSNQAIQEDAPLHTAKVLFATEKLNSLLTLPTLFSIHTPFIICMISNMTIAHLSACRHVFREPRLSLEREKIRLNMGVLKMLGEFWPSGAREYREMGVIAREVLSLQEEDFQIPKASPIVTLNCLDLDFDFNATFDICDIYGNDERRGNPPVGASLKGGFGTTISIP